MYSFRTYSTKMCPQASGLVYVYFKLFASVCIFYIMPHISNYGLKSKQENR